MKKMVPGIYYNQLLVDDKLYPFSDYSTMKEEYVFQHDSFLQNQDDVTDFECGQQRGLLLVTLGGVCVFAKCWWYSCGRYEVAVVLASHHPQ